MGPELSDQTSKTNLQIFLETLFQAEGLLPNDFHQKLGQAFEAILTQVGTEEEQLLLTFFSQLYKDGLPFQPQAGSFTKPRPTADVLGGVFFSWLTHDQYYVGKARSKPELFIHKNIKQTLTDALEDFVKHMLLDLTDISKSLELQKRLEIINGVHSVGRRLIQILSIVEDFHRDLWEKPKFTLATHYLITLDLINKAFYPSIAHNERQRKQWRQLYSFDPQVSDTKSLVDLLSSHGTLTVDTQFFDPEFTYELLSSFHDLDSSLTGLLIKSDNYQALRLIQPRFGQSISSVYIDPPYNTGSNVNLPYKDRYQSSTWLSLMFDRMVEVKKLLAEDGLFFCHIDENEFENLQRLIKEVFGVEQKLNPIVWNKGNPKGDARAISSQHEYICGSLRSYEHFRKSKRRLLRNKANAVRILAKAEQLVRTGEDSVAVNSRFREWMAKQRDFSGGERAYHRIDEDGDVYRQVSMAWPNKKKAPDRYFTPLIHPVTGKECPVPKRGWRNPPETMQELLTKGLIIFGEDESVQPTRKYFLKENMQEKVPSIVYYAASDDDFFADLGLVFEYPKPVFIAKYILQIATIAGQGTILDYFAGSGTTGQATLELNKEDEGNRRFILVESSESFEEVLKPRLLKVIYSETWKEGQPTGTGGYPHQLIRYQTIEQYDDSLEALVGQFQEPQHDAGISYGLGQGQDNTVLRSLQWSFADPFNTLIMTQEGQPKPVDLIESFNYLAGVWVERIHQRTHQKRRYVVVEGTRDEKKVLVVWRVVDDTLDLEAEKLLVEQELLARSYDEVYLNSTSSVPNSFAVEEVLQEIMFGKEEPIDSREPPETYLK